MLVQLLTLSRSQKRMTALCFDLVALLAAYAFALCVRYEAFYWPQDYDVLWSIAIAIPVSMFLFSRFGLYKAVVRYMALSALLVVCLGVLSSSIVLAVAVSVLGAAVPYSVIINYALMSLVLIGGSRLLMRTMYEKRESLEKERVIIYGAGSAGRQLAQALMNGKEYHPVCFVDDDETLQGSSILGLSILSSENIEQVVNECDAKRVLLAIPSVARSRRKEILDFLEPLRVTVQSIPGMADMVDGTMSIDELQDVRIEDLLGRDPVEPRKALMNTNIYNKHVLVTGAGGSIGSELCRQIIQYEPKVLVLLEACEFNLYTIDRELTELVAKKQLHVALKPILCSVQNRARLTHTMRHYGIETVYHAAAYKHVPLVEYNIIEGIRNNVFGTWNLAEAATETQVKDFVLISTDKAVRPTNVMGATKRLSELVLQGMANREDNRTRFAMVRFGNVLGSSGSVVPLFRQQIIDGGPVTVTDPEITRYFMTIPEAAQLVIQAGAMGSLTARETGSRGGDVFVLDMGEPVKIDYLARKLIRLMGLEVRDANNPDGDIEIKYSGLRPGEKLYEELLIGDDVQLTDHPRIMTARELSLPWYEIKALLEELDTHCTMLALEALHRILREAPLGFQPSSCINDLMYCNEKARKKECLAEMHQD